MLLKFKADKIFSIKGILFGKFNEIHNGPMDSSPAVLKMDLWKENIQQLILSHKINESSSIKSLKYFI